jgi:hypothetical protein
MTRPEKLANFQSDARAGHDNHTGRIVFSLRPIGYNAS